jgi:guanylate kinase
MSSGTASPATPGRLIVLSGPSGVGKDTVLRELFAIDPGLRYSVSYTTRPPRRDEEDGVAYSFVDSATFDKMIKRGEFLEWADIYAHRYGTALQRVLEAIARGEEIVLKIDVQGAESVRERMGNDATFIFLLPPSKEELRRRLVRRATEDPADVELRWARAVGELAEQDKYDHRVVNDDARRAAEEISAIIEAERTARHAGLAR